MPARDLAADPLFGRLAALSAVQTRYAPTPQVAGRMGAIAGRYPWMSPGVGLSLAESGADDGFVDQVATEEAKHRHKRGFGWSSIGNALASAGGLVGDVIKPVTRAGFTVLESPYQEVKSLTQAGLATVVGQGSFGENLRTSAFGESTGIQALQSVAHGKQPDLGEGYFSGGDIREHYQTESGKLRHHGQSITLGRVFADTVFEPGSKPYNVLSGLVDAGAEIFGDPTIYAGEALGKAAEARRLFAVENSAGLVNGLRKTVLSETAAEWLASPRGRTVVEHIAGERDVDRLWRTLGRKPDVDTLVKLADARTADEVTAVLRPKLGIEEAWREKPRLIAQESAKSTAFQTVFGRHPRDIRAFGDVPANKLDFTRPEEALKTFDDWQLNARVPHELRSVNNTALARAMAKGTGLDRYEAVVKRGAKAVRESLVAHGADDERAAELTELWVNSHSETVKYLIDDTGKELSIRKVMVNGKDQDLPAPFWLSQALGNTMDLPAARDIRRATASPWMQKTVMNKYGDLRLPIAALDKLQQDVWKPMTLIRGAWPVRVIGEEQVRMGAVGLKNAFTHPLSYIAWAVGSESRTGRLIESLGGKVGRGAIDPLGRDIAAEAAFSEAIGQADEFASAMNRRATQWSGRDAAKRVRLDDWTVYDRADSEFPHWWEDNLLRVNSDPVAQRIAGGLRKGDRIPTPDIGKMGVAAPFRKMETRILDEADRDWVPAAHREIYEQWEVKGHVYELVRDQRGGGPEWMLTRIDREGRRLPNGRMADRGAVQAEAAFDVTPRGIEVHKVQVDPKFQQQGFNTELTEALEDLARGEGLDLHRTSVVNPVQRGHLERAGYEALPEDFRPAAFGRYTDIEGPNYVKRFGGGVTTKPPTGLDAVKEWYFEGTGRKFRNDLAQVRPELATRAGADAYIDTAWGELQRLTGGDDDLLKAIASPELRRRAMTEGGFGRSQLGDQLRDLSDRGIGPQKVTGMKTARKGIPRDQVKEVKDRTVDRLFEVSMGIPSDKLSRSPTFRQYLWQRAEELFPRLTPQGQAEVLANAEKARLPASTLKRLRSVSGSGDLTAEMLDDVAKHYALGQTRELLYDLHKRNQFFDAARLVFPFGEAWKEVVGTWARIGARRPQTIRRFQQIMEGARGNDLDPATGFFHTNQFGEEVFCVDEETEALTQRGWLKHTDLTTDDRVLSLDPDTDTVRWVPVLSLHRFSYSGEMIRWSGRVNACTTPNHRWLVENWRTVKPTTGARKRRDHRWTDSPKREFKTTAWLSAQYQRAIVVGGGTPMACASYPTFADEFVELLGWVITEGCYDKRGNAITVTQSEDVNPEPVERLRRLVKYFSDQGATANEWTKRRGDQCTFYFGKGIASHIRAVAPGKQITAAFLGALTLPQAEMLLETLLDGDGHRRPKDGHRQWLQVDADRVAGFQMLCAMLGIRTQASWEQGRHRVTLHKVRSIYKTNATSEQYDGIVWCPRTPTGVWLARHRGSTHWTGNTFPGSQFMTGALIGVPVPLEGRVQGLNLMAQAYPGFGPAVSVPAGYLLPDKPEWDAIRSVILPFGEPDTSGGFAESFLPAWVQKLRQGLGKPADQRLFANTVADMQRYLLSTGDYSTDSPEAINRLMRDAKKKAKMLYVVRGIAQFGAPTAPTPEMLIHDKSGDLVFQSALAEEYRKLQEDDYTTATGKFIAKFGENAMLVMQAKTQTLSYGSPVTAEGLRWAREHPALVDAFPHVYGLLGPQGGKFSSEAYARGIENGDREPLTPEQAIQLGNTRVANLIYHQAKDAAPTTDEGRAWLRQVRAALIERYPGFGDDVALKTNTDTLIRELQSAAKDPDVLDTDAGQGLALYMEARAQAAAAAPNGLFQNSQATRPLRDWLRLVADKITERHPGFAAVFDQGLSRELADDIKEAAA